jgi:hypothetical protein
VSNERVTVQGRFPRFPYIGRAPAARRPRTDFGVALPFVAVVSIAERRFAQGTWTRADCTHVVEASTNRRRVHGCVDIGGGGAAKTSGLQGLRTLFST